MSKNKMTTLIGIQTTRYSTFMKQILCAYNSDVVLTIGIQAHSPSKFTTYSDKDIPYLIKSWCTNTKIKNTTFFNLKQHGEELFGFHDHPDNMWADISVLPFIEKIAQEKIIRFQIAEVKPSQLTTLIKKIIGRT